MKKDREGELIDVLFVEEKPGDVRLPKEALKEGDINKTPDVVTNGEEDLDFVYQYGERKAVPCSNTVLLGLNLSKTIEYKFLMSNEDDPNLNTVPTSYLIRPEFTRT